jgi:TPR repeat protein
MLIFPYNIYILFKLGSYFMKHNVLFWIYLTILILLYESVFSAENLKFQFYKNAAVKYDEVAAQFELANAYYTGKGVTKDIDKAIKWYRKVAAKGHAVAQHNLGVIYRAQEDYLKAAKWYRKAAEQGDVRAQNNLADLYMKGLGFPIDKIKAIKWYGKAAEKGYKVAQYNLGVIYYYGDGINKNYSQAFNWYRKAAEQNHAEAQYYLGLAYTNGKGVVQNTSKAIEWYKRSAQQGVLKAQQAWMKYKDSDVVAAAAVVNKPKKLPIVEKTKTFIGKPLLNINIPPLASSISSRQIARSSKISMFYVRQQDRAFVKNIASYLRTKAYKVDAVNNVKIKNSRTERWDIRYYGERKAARQLQQDIQHYMKGDYRKIRLRNFSYLRAKNPRVRKDRIEVWIINPTK